MGLGTQIRLTGLGHHFHRLYPRLPLLRPNRPLEEAPLARTASLARTIRFVDQGVESLLVLRVSLGDVGDEVVGHYLHIIGEARADDRHSPLHPSMECVPHSVPHSSAQVAQLVNQSVASSRLPRLVRRLKQPRSREVVNCGPQSTSQHNLPLELCLERPGVGLGRQQLILKPYKDRNKRLVNKKRTSQKENKRKGIKSSPRIFSSRAGF